MHDALIYFLFIEGAKVIAPSPKKDIGPSFNFQIVRFLWFDIYLSRCYYVWHSFTNARGKYCHGLRRIRMAQEGNSCWS